MKNKKLAILGHPTRYKEVIEILEMLSGEKIIFQGNNSECCYYLQNSIHLINVEDVDWFEPNNFVIFTLEDFLQKYPYKVGDKVLLNNQVKVIKGVGWDSTNNEVIYTLETNINGVNTQYQVFNYDLLPYKEEDDDTKIYTDNAINDDSKTDIIINGENLIAPNGYTIENATRNNNRLIVEYIKNNLQYPKSYEGCRMILNQELEEQSTLGYKGADFYYFQLLIICRDAYWKIAGEELGLSEPWKPNFGENFIYAIGAFYGTIQKTMVTGGRGILLFPTEEMRDAFYENFKFLIDKCKEFL